MRIKIIMFECVDFTLPWMLLIILGFSMSTITVVTNAETVQQLASLASLNNSKASLSSDVY